MKRARPVETASSSTSSFDLNEDVIMYILKILYHLTVDEAKATHVSLFNDIVRRAMVLLIPCRCATAFLLEFIPLIERVQDETWHYYRHEVIPLFRNIRKLDIYTFADNLIEGGCFKELRLVEEVHLSYAEFQMAQMKEWKSLRFFSVGPKCKLVVPISLTMCEEIMSSVFGRLNELCFVFCNSAKFIRRNLFLQEIGPYCTNLKTLCLDDHPAIINNIFTHLYSLTSLHLHNNSTVGDNELSCMTSLRYLDVGDPKKITEEGLSSIAPTLRKLKIGTSSYSIGVLTMLTGLEDLTINHNRHIFGYQFALMTNLKSITINSSPPPEGSTRDDILQRICLPPSLNKLSLHPHGRYVVSDRTLLAVTNLTSLSLVEDSNLSQYAFQRLAKSLCSLTIIEKTTVLTDSIVSSLTNLTHLDITTTGPDFAYNQIGTRWYKHRPYSTTNLRFGITLDDFKNKKKNEPLIGS